MALEDRLLHVYDIVLFSRCDISSIFPGTIAFCANVSVLLYN